MPVSNILIPAIPIAGRKNFSDKVSETLTPDNQKTTYQKAKEGVTNTLDNAAAAVTPASEKGTTQRAADQAHVDKEAAKNDGQSLLETAKEYIDQAADYITGNSTNDVSKPSSGGNL